MGIEEELQKAQQSNSEKVGITIVERIKAGESTGDALRDVLLIDLINSRGKFEHLKQIEEKYNRLRENVNSHQGQQMMVVYTDHTRISEAGCMGGALYTKTIPEMELGIISDKMAVIPGEGKIIVPTSALVHRGDWFYRDSCEKKNWKRKEGNIGLSSFLGAFYDNINLGRQLPRYGIPCAKEINIIVGNKEVEFYFLVGKEKFNDLTEERLVLEQRNAKQQEKEDYNEHVRWVLEHFGKENMFYDQALRLLGVKK